MAVGLQAAGAAGSVERRILGGIREVNQDRAGFVEKPNGIASGGVTKSNHSCGTKMGTSIDRGVGIKQAR